MHEFTLFAKGTVTCHAYPVADACDARLPFEVEVIRPYEYRFSELTTEEVAEYCIDEVVTAEGWCKYAHPGGMRYSPQWYCPRHVNAILAYPDDAEDEFTRRLKDQLWPDPRKRRPHSARP